MEAKFEYSYNYIKDLNKSSMKTYNMIAHIALFLMLCGVGVMFAVARNIFLGVTAAVTFVILLVGFVFANKSVERANLTLLGQQVKITFGEEEMIMTAKLGKDTLYTAKFAYAVVKSVKVKDDLAYVKFDKTQVLVIPKAGFKTEADFTKAIEYLSNNYVI